MKIYVITSGEYSNYHIDTVLTNKKEAIKYIEKYDKDNEWHDDISIEVWENGEKIDEIELIKIQKKKSEWREYWKNWKPRIIFKES